MWSGAVPRAGPAGQRPVANGRWLSSQPASAREPQQMFETKPRGVTLWIFAFLDLSNPYRAKERLTHHQKQLPACPFCLWTPTHGASLPMQLHKGAHRDAGISWCYAQHTKSCSESTTAMRRLQQLHPWEGYALPSNQNAMAGIALCWADIGDEKYDVNPSLG